MDHSATTSQLMAIPVEKIFAFICILIFYTVFAFQPLTTNAAHITVIALTVCWVLIFCPMHKFILKKREHKLVFHSLLYLWLGSAVILSPFFMIEVKLVPSYREAEAAQSVPVTDSSNRTAVGEFIDTSSLAPSVNVTDINGSATAPTSSAAANSLKRNRQQQGEAELTSTPPSETTSVPPSIDRFYLRREYSGESVYETIAFKMAALFFFYAFVLEHSSTQMLICTLIHFALHFTHMLDAKNLTPPGDNLPIYCYVAAGAQIIITILRHFVYKYLERQRMKEYLEAGGASGRNRTTVGVSYHHRAAAGGVGPGAGGGSSKRSYTPTIGVRGAGDRGGNTNNGEHQVLHSTCGELSLTIPSGKTVGGSDTDGPHSQRQQHDDFVSEASGDQFLTLFRAPEPYEYFSYAIANPNLSPLMVDDPRLYWVLQCCVPHIRPAYFVLDRYAVVSAVNRYFVSMTHIPEEFIIGRSLESFLEWAHGENIADIMSLVHTLLLNETVAFTPCRVLLKGAVDTAIWGVNGGGLQTTPRGGEDSAGHFAVVLDFYKSTNEITGESEVIAQQPTRHAIVDVLPVSLCLVQNDGTILHWSQQLSQVTDISAYTMIGQNLFTSLLGTPEKPMMRPKAFPYVQEMRLQTSRGTKLLSITIFEWRLDCCNGMDGAVTGTRRNSFSGGKHRTTAPPAANTECELLCLIERSRRKDRSTAHLLTTLRKMLDEHSRRFSSNPSFSSNQRYGSGNDGSNNPATNSPPPLPQAAGATGGGGASFGNPSIISLESAANGAPLIPQPSAATIGAMGGGGGGSSPPGGRESSSASENEALRTFHDNVAKIVLQLSSADARESGHAVGQLTPRQPTKGQDQKSGASGPQPQPYQEPLASFAHVDADSPMNSAREEGPTAVSVTMKGNYSYTSLGVASPGDMQITPSGRAGGLVTFIDNKNGVPPMMLPGAPGTPVGASAGNQLLPAYTPFSPVALPADAITAKGTDVKMRPLNLGKVLKPSADAASASPGEIIAGGSSLAIWAKLISQDSSKFPSCAICTAMGKSFKAGRSAHCQYRIGDTFVSSVQFSLHRKPSGKDVATVLVDHSANGTFVNVKCVGKGKSCVLNSGDLINFRLSTGVFFVGFKFYTTKHLAMMQKTSGQDVVDRNFRGGGSATGLGEGGVGRNSKSRHGEHERREVQPSDVKIGEEMLGKGGNAEVFLGINLSDGNLIAVKRVRLPKDDDTTRRQYKCLQEEINLLAVASHRNIVQYYGSFESDTHLNILLEFVPGGSIRHLLDNFGALGDSVILRYLAQMLEGLSYLHRSDIVHGDLKCANVLVTDKGEVKIADFGTGKLLQKKEETASDTHTVAGTLLWMAPELARSDTSKSTFSSDIWSVGCCLIEMISGSHPWVEYDFDSIDEIWNLLKYGTEPPEIPHTENQLLHTMAFECLKLNPNERPKVEQLLDMMREYYDSL